VGLANYNSVLHVGVQPEGLHLSVMALFRVGHPPLLIPWDEITDVRRRTMLWYTLYALRIGTPHAVTVRVPENVMVAVRESRPGGGSLTAERPSP
jgi:hypothetical protein